MKKLRGIAGLVALLVMVLACFTPLVMATEYWGTIGASYEVKGNGRSWVIDLTVPVVALDYTTRMIVVEDILSMEAEWWNDFIPDGGSLDIDSKEVVISESGAALKVYFKRDVLKAIGVPATGSALDITMTNGDIIYLTGPGFGYRWG